MWTVVVLGGVWLGVVQCGALEPDSHGEMIEPLPQPATVNTEEQLWFSVMTTLPDVSHLLSISSVAAAVENNMKYDPIVFVFVLSVCS